MYKTKEAKIEIEIMADIWKLHGPLDMSLRFIIGTAFLLYILWYGTVFEAHYPPIFVELYAYPWWRGSLVVLVLALAYWCPRVGIIAALATLLYLSDMKTLTSEKFVDNKKPNNTTN